MKAILYPPGLAARLVDLEGFKHLQELCGGHVERIILDVDRSVRPRRIIQLWCNEDSIALGMPANLYARGPTYTGTIIYGPAVLLAAERRPDDEYDLPLTEEEVARWFSAFPRALLGVG